MRNCFVELGKHLRQLVPFLVLLLPIIMLVSFQPVAAALEIPCNAPNFTISSHSSYTLHDCIRADGSPYLHLFTAGYANNVTAATSMVDIVNVSIVVKHFDFDPEYYGTNQHNDAHL